MEGYKGKLRMFVGKEQADRIQPKRTKINLALVRLTFSLAKEVQSSFFPRTSDEFRNSGNASIL
jgi:hypothetical protein